MAAADGNVDDRELDAIGNLLGEDHSRAPDDLASALSNLDGRIQAALEVPLARRAQLIQHLTIVVAADGTIHELEMRTMEDIATKLRVDPVVIHQTIHGAMHPMD